MTFDTWHTRKLPPAPPAYEPPTVVSPGGIVHRLTTATVTGCGRKVGDRWMPRGLGRDCRSC